jgi:hypothetical protein
MDMGSELRVIEVEPIKTESPSPSQPTVTDPALEEAARGLANGHE